MWCRVSSPVPAERAGRTDLRRLALVLVPVAAASAVLVTAVGAGVVPVALAVSARSPALSGRAFQVAADRLAGTGFTQITARDTTSQGAFPDAVSRIDSADLYHLCQSVVTRIPGLGAVTMVITAGDGGRPAHADHLVVRTDDLAGDAVFGNVLMGVDASTVGGAPGEVGQRADSVVIDHLRQQTRSVSAGTFRLTGLHLSVSPSASPCF